MTSACEHAALTQSFVHGKSPITASRLATMTKIQMAAALLQHSQSKYVVFDQPPTSHCTLLDALISVWPPAFERVAQAGLPRSLDRKLPDCNCKRCFHPNTVGNTRLRVLAYDHRPHPPHRSSACAHGSTMRDISYSHSEPIARRDRRCEADAMRPQNALYTNSTMFQ